MNFNSLSFLIFLVIVLLLYWILPHKFRWVLLLVASYYFYMSWNATLVFLIFGTTLVSYAAALGIEKTGNKKLKKLLLIITLLVCLGTLFFFKYFEFVLGSIISFLNLFQLNVASVSFDILLPVGISFYTFQTLSYVIDVYRGEYKAEKHFGYYALFVSYFPQLVAGPIERSDHLLPQLKGEHKFNADDMYAGIRIALVGFFRKCVVADFCGIFVNNVFGNISSANSFAVFFAGVLFAFQMYNDFAGYSDIATGVARMMGVKLMKNFDRPYLSQSFTEFFRRWHISLTKWFTDYVYIPLGGNRKGVARRILNTFIVFALCGLWHGANWTYVLWGIYSACILSIEIILKKPLAQFCEKRKIDLTNPMLVLLRRTLLFLLVVFGAFIFRSQSIGQLGEVLFTLFTDVGFSATYFASAFDVLGLTFGEVIFIVLSIVAMAFVYSFGECKDDLEIRSLDKKKEQTLYAQKVSVYFYLILIIAFSWIMLLGMGDVSAFVYFQF